MTCFVIVTYIYILVKLCATGDRFLDTLTLHSQNVQRIRAIQQIDSAAYFASLLLAKARAGKALMHARAACRWKQSEAKLSKRDCCMLLLFYTFCEWSVSVSRNPSPVAHECVKEPVPGGTRMCQGTCPRWHTNVSRNLSPVAHKNIPYWWEM